MGAAAWRPPRALLVPVCWNCPHRPAPARPKPKPCSPTRRATSAGLRSPRAPKARLVLPGPAAPPPTGSRDRIPQLQGGDRCPGRHKAQDLPAQSGSDTGHTWGLLLGARSGSGGPAKPTVDPGRGQETTGDTLAGGRTPWVERGQPWSDSPGALSSGPAALAETKVRGSPTPRPREGRDGAPGGSPGAGLPAWPGTNKTPRKSQGGGHDTGATSQGGPRCVAGSQMVTERDSWARGHMEGRFPKPAPPPARSSPGTSGGWGGPQATPSGQPDFAAQGRVERCAPSHSGGAPPPQTSPGPSSAPHLLRTSVPTTARGGRLGEQKAANLRESTLVTRLPRNS